MKIRELFRQKLEGVEVTPDVSVGTKLMRQLAVREFLHFDPFRFNIFYLAGTLIVIIFAAIILSSGSENQGNPTPANIYGEIRNDSSLLKVDQPVSHKAEGTNEKVSGQIKNLPVLKPEVLPVEDTVRNIGSGINKNVSYTGNKNSILKKRFFPAASADNQKLQAGSKPGKVIFESSASEGCTPLKLRFNITSDSYDSCRWTFGDGGYSYEKNPEWIFDVEGEYKVILEVFGSDGLNETSSSIINVFPKPLARFEINPDKADFPEDEIRFSNYSTNAIHYNWDFGDGSTSELFEPRHKYAKSGIYNVQLVVSSDHGCSDSLFVINAFSGSEYFINFPNAFIPNPQGPAGGYYSSRSDENAQVFHPDFYGVSDYQLKIFSKQGILIFESSDLGIGWDGYLNGQLSTPGVYIWKVRGNFRNGEPFTKMGDVTLLRN